jgi:hypothetical protein
MTKGEAFRAMLQQAQATHAEKEAKRHAAQGPDFKRGDGKPEPQLTFYSPPESDDDWDIELIQRDLEAAKAKREKKILDALPIGGSRFGGVPDLPPELPWPLFDGKKLPFLAQIDLAEAGNSPNQLLPPEGWLFAFGYFDDGIDNRIAVLHHRGPRTALTRANPPDKTETWPDANGRPRVYDVVPLTTQKKKKWEVAGWLFGKVDEFFGTAGNFADDQNRSGDDWINLLAIQSVGSMCWSDAGHLYLVIRRQDLARGDFTSICVQICSS